MSRWLDIDISGIQEAQAANNADVAALEPRGSLGRAVQYMTVEAERYAIAVTHVLTGALKSSHRMQLQGLRGAIFLDENALGPGGRPAFYGMFEHNRGGEHAFYDRVIDEAGDRIVSRAEQIAMEGIQ